MTRGPSLFIVMSVVGLVACGKSSQGTVPGATPTSPSAPVASGPLAFSVSPIPVAAIEFIVPLGNLNPPDHTLPTDHIYFYHRLNNRAAPAYEVMAPATGTVQSISRRNDDQILIRINASATYYLDHVRLDANITTGSSVTAGQRLGMTSDQSFGLDLGLVNSAVTLPFARPARYSDNTLHADSPLKYFAEPLRSALYALVQRVGADKDGKIDFDVAGTLAGNWFAEDLPVAESGLVTAGPRQLAFVRLVSDPSQLMISSGGRLGLIGFFSIAGSQPDPASITTASGMVRYPLLRSIDGSGVPVATLIAQMLAADRVRVEIVNGTTAPSTFSDQSVVYVR